MIHIDFETRSRIDLRVVGSYRYATDPSTEILCLAWGSEKPVTELWYPEELQFDLCSDLDPLFDYVSKGGVLAAFNAAFERDVWENIMVPRHGAPGTTIEQWYCVAGQAYQHSLPGALGQVGEALGVDMGKDKEGRALMLKMCKPRKPTKSNPAEWHETPEQLQRLGEYCKQDVNVEIDIYERLTDYSDREMEIWRADRRMNEAGFCVDIETIREIGQTLVRLEKDAKAELTELTSYEVTTPNQVARMLSWCNSQGVDLPNLQSDTLKKALSEDLPDNVRKVLEIRAEFGLASVKKYAAMALNACPKDNRIRGTLRYCGASRTRRWSGQRVQPQNYARGFGDPEVIRDVIDLIRRGDLDWLEFAYGKLVQAISKVLRGMIVAAPGKELLVSDFSSIEARVLAALASCEPLLDDFWQGKDPYKSMAAAIYKVQYKDVTGEQRFFGKQAILGLGYGMGAKKFADTCAGYGKPITHDFAKEVVGLYRERNHQIVKFWRQIEQDAIKCVTQNRTILRGGQYSLRMHQLGMVMTLPNGSERWYLWPKVGMVEKFGDLLPELTYMGMDTYTRKWTRIKTYGGKLTENLVQSAAREVQADAVLRLDAEGFNPILQVHDEIICEIDPGTRTVKELEQIMGNASKHWARDWPIEAAGGWIGKRYRK